MKSWDLSELPLFIALLHLSLTVCAHVQHEDDGQSFTMALHSPPSVSAWRSLSARASAHAEALDTLATVVEATKARVAALKTGSVPRRHPGDNFAEPLYPRGYGEYSIPLSLGTPPQELSVIMDTGSDLVWVPCTANYTCKRCTATRDSHPVFLPAKSSSVERASCANPNCKSLHENQTEELCFAKGHCAGALKNCAREVCPAYAIEYGKGSTAGYLMSETLTLALKNGGAREIQRFGVGCSLISSQQPSTVGIAGFGRGGLSLPSQLGSDKFAYCLINHIYDNQNRSSTMVLGDDAVPKGVPLHYTPFLFNSKAQNSAYGVYYYIGLSGVSIGRKFLKLPPELLTFDVKGNGGTIIDSGTTFTYTDEKIFNEIAGGFDSQVAYSRAKAVEAKTGLGLCYDISNISSQHDISVPRFTFHFQGGSRMSLGVENYLIIVGKAVCLTILNTQNGNLDGDIGPAVILGNYQQQNFYILYDREKNRLGFRQQTCKPSG